MKVIVSKEQKELIISFNKFDYIFIPDKPVQVEDDLYAHLQELLPLSFDFEPKLKKDTILAKVHRTPTKVIFPGGKFGVQSANLTKEADETPGSGQSDKDGIEWYGEGIEDDKL